MSEREIPTGVGLGLRAKILDAVDAGELDGIVTFFEISPENFMHRGGRWPGKLEGIADRFPIISHGLMMSLGSTDPFDDEYFRTLESFLDRYDPPWHSDHLCFSGLDGALLHDLLPVPFTTACARRIAARVREAADRLERPMLVENISWYMYMGKSDLDEAAFIGEVLDRADCGLLLDVNNTFVNAQNHGFDVRAWLERIPLDRVRQLHIAGHELYEEGLIVDTHGADVRTEVHDLLAWVIERTGPKPVLLERDNDIPPIPALIEEVRQVDRVYQAALERWGLDHAS